MRGFRRERGVFVARLESAERPVLLDVVNGVIDLFGEVPDPGDVLDPFTRLTITEEPVDPPEDPALHRLLPDASPDPELAAELRRLTEADLRTGKVARLRLLRGALEQAAPDLVVSPAGAPDVAAALTDVRLVLAQRLGLETDDQADEIRELAMARGAAADDAESTRRFLAAVYSVLTQLQGDLVELMVSELDHGTQ
ncbi:DUF2017 domain-containing protein [Actinotalea sp. M2MS4P-6]|uniref:DUF2017 domain-containing protein n=1 Tax=Actinotalea sp. M2MS4P-6 TaxID=2983762 RepID=UPI0021E3AEC9|nr:DUF2017 domain-containing protein [Actinotalea sp. M2MS4P-6]MCV2396158.1 DUF2017 domain-containing protein [Actinotalea sp. M2MS4P-6]